MIINILVLILILVKEFAIQKINSFMNLLLLKETLYKLLVKLHAQFFLLMKQLKTQKLNKINVLKKEKKVPQIYKDLEEIKCLENDFILYSILSNSIIQF